MKKIQVLFAAAFFSLLLASSAFAQAGQWALGLRLGPSFPTTSSNRVSTVDDFRERGSGSLDLKTGPMVSGKIQYGLNDYFSLGLNAEWDSHRIPTKSIRDSFGDTFAIGGRFHTLSLLPFVEVRPVKLGDLSPYLALALGGNFNSVGSTPSGVFVANADNSFAVKVGGGFDYFLTRNLAFNSEVGWKLNRENLRFAGLDRPSLDGATAKSRFHASTVSLLFGLRYYFPTR